jgi:hypothetical protein
MREQVPTQSATLKWIMSSRKFLLGVEDVRAGRGYHPDYDCWPDVDDQWNYERGRMWGALAPRDVPVKFGSKVNPKAIRLFVRYRNDIP